MEPPKLKYPEDGYLNRLPAPNRLWGWGCSHWGDGGQMFYMPASSNTRVGDYVQFVVDKGEYTKHWYSGVVVDIKDEMINIQAPRVHNWFHKSKVFHYVYEGRIQRIADDVELNKQ